VGCVFVFNAVSFFFSSSIFPLRFVCLFITDGKYSFLRRADASLLGGGGCLPAAGKAEGLYALIFNCDPWASS